MGKIQLKAKKRSIIGRKVKQLRKQSIVPANLYGKKIKSQSIQIAIKEFVPAYENAGETGIIELIIEKGKIPALIHSVHLHPVTGSILHVDFLNVNLKEKIHARVPVEFTGSSPAVENKEGTLMTLVKEVEVEALPEDLPEKLIADISILKKPNDIFNTSSLVVPKSVKIVTKPTKELAKIAPIRKEKEEKPEEKEEEKETKESDGEKKEEGKEEKAGEEVKKG